MIWQIDDKGKVINELTSYSNLRLAKIKLKWVINIILNNVKLKKIQDHVNRLNKYLPISNSENYNDINR